MLKVPLRWVDKPGNFPSESIRLLPRFSGIVPHQSTPTIYHTHCCPVVTVVLVVPGDETYEKIAARTSETIVLFQGLTNVGLTIGAISENAKNDQELPQTISKSQDLQVNFGLGLDPGYISVSRFARCAWSA